MANYSSSFWKNMKEMSIYKSTEDDGLLADQMDAGAAGGANSSDAADDASEASGDAGGLDMDMDMGGDMGDMGGDPSGGMDAGGGGDAMAGGDAGGMGDGSEAPSNPNENPFKGQNGKALLDDKLAELQAAVTDTLERIYANPKLDQVVVSELENLQDSIRNIRQTVFMVPINASLYKYQLSTISYKQLSETICSSLKKDI